MALSNDILNAARHVKPLSANAARLLRLVADPEHDRQEVIRVVESDTVLTANVLRTVNSAAFGLRVPAETVGRAIAYLGGQLVVGIAIGSCAADTYSDPLEGYDGERGDLWRHCLRTAIAAREFATSAKGDISPDLAYTAGILHDIGKSVISAWLKGKAWVLAEEAEKLGSDYLEAERGATGTDHCEVGLAVARQWKLPETLCTVIAHHHHPGEAPADQRGIVYAVHLGDILAMMGGADTGADSFHYTLDNDYREYMPLSVSQLEGVHLQTELEFSAVRDAMFGSNHAT